ncbi:MAG: shikimate kinase [Rikenellaceae bacterium]|jgi:shikimate kinase|nr:shikimate kinase [Rikenellaceae bacterium]
MVIFLIGYMGCGKSTIGRMVAARLGAQFIDMDKQIEQQAGMTVAEIFATRGEAAFRRMETEFLEQPFDPDGITVVATGGGAPCQGDNMAVMNRAGRTIYFKMSPRRLIARLGPGRAKRPLIKDMDDEQLLDFIGRSLAVRGPVYERAHLTIDCEGVGDEYIARHIEHYIEQTKNNI